MAACCGLRYITDYPYESAILQAACLATSNIILIVSLFCFEFKHLYEAGLHAYLTSLWNINDVLLMALLVAVLKCSTSFISAGSEGLYQFLDGTRVESIIPGSTTSTAQVSWLRVKWSLLVVTMHIKVFQALQFHATAAMISEVYICLKIDSSP